MSKKTALLGSDILPALILLIAGVEVQLGEVVARAHSDSGLSAEEWNELPNDDREERLAQAVEAMRAEAQAKAEADAAEKWLADSVEALVLSDSFYGKCGEVKRFHKDEVEAIAAAGYIDPHPNAVTSAKAAALAADEG